MFSTVRHFIRHPADIPIEVVRNERTTVQPHARNVSVGGLACQSQIELEPGAIVDVRIDTVRPKFESKARVVWCTGCDEGFDLGIEFMDASDAFRARMVEQVCHIENYRKDVYRTEGRALTSEQAAREWISKHAADFPNPGTESTH